MSDGLQVSRYAFKLVVPGAWIVFRMSMRRRNALQDLYVSMAITSAVFLIAHRVAARVSMVSSSDSGSRLVAGWMLPASIGVLWATSILSAVFGSISAPARSEFEPVLGALLTRLKPWHVCAGRLIAGLWVPISATLLSCALMLCAAMYRGAGASDLRATATSVVVVRIAVVHLLIIVYTIEVGALSQFAGLNRTPGRSFPRGLVTGLGLIVLSTITIWLINPAVVAATRPERWINIALLVNPTTGIASIFDVDLIRASFLYSHLQASDYLFAYPGAFAMMLVSAAVSVAAIIAAGAQLRRAYR